MATTYLIDVNDKEVYVKTTASDPPLADRQSPKSSFYRYLGTAFVPHHLKYNAGFIKSKFCRLICGMPANLRSGARGLRRATIPGFPALGEKQQVRFSPAVQQLEWLSVAAVEDQLKPTPCVSQAIRK